MSGRSLQDALAKLSKTYGEAVITDLNDMKPLDCVPTGLPNLDHIIGQSGIPRGKIVEIYGRESTGKSLLCAHIAGQVQAQGGRVLWLDYEHSLNKDFCLHLGVVPGPDLQVVIQVQSKLDSYS